MTDTAPPYPGIGKPCNGCGMCCALEPCEIAVMFADVVEAPCKAMEFEDGRFYCGMVRNPSHYSDMPDFLDPFIGAMFGRALGIGTACDSDGPEIESLPCLEPQHAER